MSIPPLVCSTPPPPDQCEDDKDPEDFDLSYSLSQEDEDDDDNNVYNYGNFSAYSNFQSSPDNNTEIKGEEMTKSLESGSSKEILSKQENDNEAEHNNPIHSVLENNDINENKLKCEEDINIEDLNLKVDEEIESVVESNTEQIETNEHHNGRLKDFDIPCNSNNDSPSYDNTNVSSFDDNVIDSIDTVKELNSELFDDFQSVKVSSDITNGVENSENPWENSDSNGSDFGNFTANFEDNKFDNDDFTPAESTTLSNNLHRVECEMKETDINIEDDDDFGDFNDFKSSTVQPESNELAFEEHNAESSECHELPVLNLQSTENEHQIMESITKVLTSVFLEEISEPETDFEAKLESLLSETWGHLMETDERQPYIVNWNNSLGQKTLLKALCIDSRNILFGPKWSSNMPKYAANLSIAPLQPQKQVSTPSSVVTQNEIIAEKSSNKPTTWSDPFTSDGQESCNTENENATITPGTTELDVFETPMSIKSDKIYSNTMDVQPLRQINLPDTHIFTPTDSEIPRSKTIHYDRSPTVLLPQPTIPDKNPTDTVNVPSTHNAAENVTDDSEYWEFQNFKSTSESDTLPPSTSNSQQQVTSQGNSFETASIVNALPKANIAYQTELLQPIKVEPAMPTLNWPDPGEVKGVFDDFTDFVSIPSQPMQRQDYIKPTEPHLVLSKPDNLSAFNEKTDGETTNLDNDEFDDDFDTFQSALPTKNVSDSAKSNYLGNPSNEISSSRIAEIDYGSPKPDSIKSETISFANISKPNEALTQNIGYISNTTELTNKSSPQSGKQIQTTLLQPTPVSFSAVNPQSQQKSGQILQPLSLESYSQINWPSPGIDLQDLSRFNPVETLHSLKSDLTVNSLNKVASPAHVAKNTMVNQVPDDDVWGEFVSSKPKQQQQSLPKKPSVLVDDDEWTDFISSPTVKPQNGLNTISLNVHTNSNMQKSVQSKFSKKSNQPPLDIPTLNYITPKSNPHKSYNDKHFQNL